MLGMLKRQWFMVGIVLVIFLAWMYPPLGRKGGYFVPEITVKYVGVAVIFLNSGLSLETEALRRALVYFKLHVFIQGFTLGIVPYLMYGLVQVLNYTPLDPGLLQGLIVVGCMPPPVSSAVILTKAAHGNVAAAIFNSAFGSFLGIFVTPMLLLYFMGSSAAVPFTAVVTQLAATVVLPLVVGQVARAHYRLTLDRAGIPFGTISSAILLLIIYTTFCDTFSSHQVAIDELSLFSIVFIVILLQVALLLLTFYLTTQPILEFTPSDTIAAIFCSTHKSLTLGIPMLKVVFSSHPGLSVISLPLLIYHPSQILLGSFVVPLVSGWAAATEKYSYRRRQRFII